MTKAIYTLSMLVLAAFFALTSVSFATNDSGVLQPSKQTPTTAQQSTLHEPKMTLLAANPGCPGMCQSACQGRSDYSSCYQACLRNCK